MKTKREVLETIVERTTCFNIKCYDCPFKEGEQCNLLSSLIKLGAKEMLKTLSRELEKENEQLKQQIGLYKEMLNRNPCVRIPDWHCNDCLEENKQLKQQITKIKTCHFNGCIGCTHKNCEVKE